MTPATAQQFGLAGTGGIDRWSFPSVSAYAATVADNGNAISAYNSPVSFLSVTLPQTNAINPGWTIAIVNDNGKTANVQVNTTNGGKISIPAVAATRRRWRWRRGLRRGGAAVRRVEFPGHAGDAGDGRAIGLSGGTCLEKWVFPSVSTYAAGLADCGTVMSAYNTPIGSLTVTLPLDERDFGGLVDGVRHR